MQKNILHTKLGFNLNLTPLLQNSIKLLSMPYLEFVAEINRALENNIVLIENSKNYDYSNSEYYQYKSNKDNQIEIEFKDSLLSSLNNQLLNATLNIRQNSIATVIMENLTEEGFLEVDIETIAHIYHRYYPQEIIDVHAFEIVRRYIQNNFEPFGIGSFNMQEFLLLQINRQYNLKNKSLISDLLLDKIDINKITPKQKTYFLSTIRNLSKTPTDNFDSESQIQYITADISIKKDHDKWYIKLKTLPKITLNKQYLSLRYQIKDKSLFNQHLMEARGLINCINYRNQYLQQITKALIEKQEFALLKGLKFLNPLSQKQLSLELNIGESTLSRLIRDKYINTPIGIIKVKDLFSARLNNYASKAIQQKVLEIIKQETKVLSDQKITDLLIEEDININRRTVTKYRKVLNIPCARVRKLIQ